ncbi:agmatinase [Paucidesulfovibrio longus]|uniref:agmatinase n=1 Tax=Paucidesulfovibrio longus TaxID=889 RepID=UPI0003B5F7AC|nr:agmatinase [Paucidesulfovibrio longus]
MDQPNWNGVEFEAPDFLESELADRSPENCRFHVIPAPFEASVSYGGGTANGPAAILEASQQLEVWDGLSAPAVLGIHTTPAVNAGGTAQSVVSRIEAAVSWVAERGAVPVLLGGEHTVTLGALRALAARHERFGIVQFDAHADLRQSYEGSKLSHACVMRRALDLTCTDGLHPEIFQIGVRALSPEEVALRRERGIAHLDARALALHGIPRPLLPPDFPEKVYLTFDVDGLDPSVIRATGTPVPGGVGWHDALTLAEMALKGRTVLGFDVVELAPAEGDHASDFAAAQLVYALMGMVQRG